MAYDTIEPLDPAGVLLKGFAGKPEPPSWESAYSKMHEMATAENHLIMVPNGMTPQQVWNQRKDEW